MNLRRIRSKPYVFGHAGDGNLHVVLAVNPSDEKEWATLEDINDRIVSQSVELGGTCTGQHGVGIGKRKFMELEHAYTGNKSESSKGGQVSNDEY
jgi:D-lactate dehydrogenase (cytochrome)